MKVIQITLKANADINEIEMLLEENEIETIEYNIDGQLLTLIPHFEDATLKMARQFFDLVDGESFTLA